MADIELPQLGESVTEGTITRWFKGVGDQVAEDEPLFEVSTDKVDSEVPSPASGYLVEILVPEGVHVALGGFAFLGGRDYRVRESSLRPGTPVVHVRARAVLGGVTVRTKPFTARR